MGHRALTNCINQNVGTVCPWEEFKVYFEVYLKNHIFTLFRNVWNKFNEIWQMYILEFLEDYSTSTN